MSRLRPSPAMVVAFIALIASVTSGAYAAANIPDGSITNPKLADNSVWHRNIGSRSVRNVNINDGAVNNRTMAPNSVWHAQIGTGSVQQNNIQPQLLTTLESKSGSTGFQTTGTITTPQAITSAGTVVASGGSIATTELSEAALVLNGSVLVTNTNVAARIITCVYTVTNEIAGAPATLGQVVQPVAPGSTVPIVLATRVPIVSPDTHDIAVRCTGNFNGVNAIGGEFTGAATG